MRTAGILVLLLLIASSCLSIAPTREVAGATSSLARAPQSGGNRPPEILSVRFVKWPELVGEPIEGYVNASDPEGQEITVIAMFVLTGEWAEGVPEEAKIHNITGVPAPEHGPNCFRLAADTSDWLPGAYVIVIVAKDELGAKSTYEYKERGLLRLRLEFQPPPETRIWSLAGLAILACLSVVMIVGIVKALRAKRKPVRPMIPVFFPPAPPSPDVY